MPALAVYKPVPKEFSKQYKNEIEKTVKYQIPIAKKSINSIFKEVKTEENSYIKTVTIEQGVNSVIFDFYLALIDVTDKYINIKQDIQPTDWYGDLKVTILPYLNDNHVDISKINSFLDYAQKKQIELENKYKY